jgi:hypothetical protein
VNNLDLEIIGPDGTRYYPWYLNPLPQDTTTGNYPPSNGLDPIDSADVQPAQQGVNNQDNVEVVDVDGGGGSLASGTWKVVVYGTQIQAGNKQDYSVVSDYKLHR